MRNFILRGFTCIIGFRNTRYIHRSRMDFGSHVTFHDQVFALEGELNTDKVRELRGEGIQSVLFLCKDTTTDNCFPEGFSALSAQFADGAAKHVPLDPSRPEFSGDNSKLQFPWQPILTYRNFEYAILRLPLPTVIVCKTATRASAVYAAFKGVSQRLTKEQVLHYAELNGLKYMQKSFLQNWVDTVVDSLSRRTPLVFRQLFEAKSSTYTYLLADHVTHEAVLIDPVLETAERDSQLIKDLGLNLKYILNTHVHADHVTGTGMLKQLHPGAQSVISAASGARADVLLNEFEFVQFGGWKLYALATPGHTPGCVSYVLDDLSRVFTGDVLLVRGCGRTDFQGGSAEQLYDSVTEKLYKMLPDDCAVFPGHDYRGQTQSSIAEEKKSNPRLTKTKEVFVEMMANLNLPPPAQIEVAVPANLQCGL